MPRLVRGPKNALSRLAAMLASLIALVWLAGCSGCSKKPERVTIALPALGITFASDFVAEDRGFWVQEGLDVKLEVIDGIQAINALLGGNVDFATIAAVPFLRANARGQKLVAIANLLDGSQTEIVVSKAFAGRLQLDPSAPADVRARALRGARIGVDATNGFPHLYLKYVAKKAGLDPDRDVTVAQIAMPAMLAALASGQIDGICVGRPWTSMARNKGGAVTVVSSAAGDFPELVPLNQSLLLTRPGYCDTRPAACRGAVNGLKKALAFMHDSPAETASILRKRFDKIDAAALDETLVALMQRTPRTTVIGEAGFVNAQQFLLTSASIRPEERLASFNDVYTNAFAK